MVISMIDLFFKFNLFKTEGLNIFICDLAI
jgi:hypothetical protein